MRSPNENNRTRQGQQNNRRGRHNNNRRNNNNNSNNSGGKPQNMLTRNFDSNGPDVKIRGNAQTIADKYTSLADDAISSGSRIIAENYFQHAEHYKRIVATATEQQAEQKAAHQAKMDAQQAAQQEKRDAHAARQQAEREQSAAQAEQQAPVDDKPVSDNLASDNAEVTNNENAPVSILDNNQPELAVEPSSSIDALNKALSSDAETPVEEAPIAEAKPKRKRVTRPKRKPVAKKEATADESSAPEATESDAPATSE